MRDYNTQPKKEYRDVMNYKSAQIQKFADSKQESMRIFSSGRDAVEIVNTWYSKKNLTESEVKDKILEWRKWLYVEIYGQNEEFYQNNTSPF